MAFRTEAGTGRRTHEFVWGQFSIAVPVEGLEDFDRIGDFIGINDAIVIGVEREDNERGRRTMMRRAARAAGTSGTSRPGLLSAGTSWIILRDNPCGCAECYGRNQPFQSNLHLCVSFLFWVWI
jgi:hypothetical protein